jgi:hypothetical protein
MPRSEGRKILELAVNGASDLIPTGDADLLALNPFRGIGITSPADFLFADGAAGSPDDSATIRASMLIANVGEELASQCPPICQHPGQGVRRQLYCLPHDLHGRQSMAWHMVLIEKSDAAAANGSGYSFVTQFQRECVTALADRGAEVRRDVRMLHRASDGGTKHWYCCSQAAADIAPDTLKRWGSSAVDHPPDLSGFKPTPL